MSNLKDIGYTCVAMHPYYATGWSRNQVYPDIGYDEMHFIDDFDQSKILREYITDQELYDKIIDRYESRGANEKLYLMGITMQNHGGYGEPYDNFHEDVYKIGRSYTDANQYLSLVHESDKAVENLINYFSSVDDPHRCFVRCRHRQDWRRGDGSTGFFQRSCDIVHNDAWHYVHVDRTYEYCEKSRNHRCADKGAAAGSCFFISRCSKGSQSQ